jgi:hypothetical protein
MLPTTGLVGGCGIGLNLLLDAIAEVSPLPHPTAVIARSVSDEAIHTSHGEKWIASLRSQ